MIQTSPHEVAGSARKPLVPIDTRGRYQNLYVTLKNPVIPESTMSEIASEFLPMCDQ
jgi:hypothetical protein